MLKHRKHVDTELGCGGFCYGGGQDNARVGRPFTAQADCHICFLGACILQLLVGVGYCWAQVWPVHTLTLIAHSAGLLTLRL